MVVNIFIFIIGAIIGSFLNVLIHRLPRDISIIFPNSFCPNCNKPIKFYDNIPIISCLLLRGKCRSCRAKIPLRYPIVEILTGILFVTINTLLGFMTLGFIFAVFFVCFLIVAFFTDLETQTLPDMPSYLTIAVGLAYNFLSNNLMSSLWGLFWGFSILYLIGFFGKLYYKKDVLGGGDILLAAAFGAFLGAEKLILALSLGYLIGALASIILIALKKKNLQDYIPFAPSLVLGALISLLFGHEIIKLYVAYFP